MKNSIYISIFLYLFFVNFLYADSEKREFEREYKEYKNPNRVYNELKQKKALELYREFRKEDIEDALGTYLEYNKVNEVFIKELEQMLDPQIKKDWFYIEFGIDAGGGFPNSKTLSLHTQQYGDYTYGNSFMFLTNAYFKFVFWRFKIGTGLYTYNENFSNDAGDSSYIRGVYQVVLLDLDLFKTDSFAIGMGIGGKIAGYSKRIHFNLKSKSISSRYDGEFYIFKLYYILNPYDGFYFNSEINFLKHRFYDNDHRDNNQDNNNSDNKNYKNSDNSDNNNSNNNNYNWNQEGSTGSMAFHIGFGYRW